MKTLEQLFSEAWRESPRGFKGVTWDRAVAVAKAKERVNGAEALLVHCGGYALEEITDDLCRDDRAVKRALKNWLATWRENGDGRAWGSL